MTNEERLSRKERVEDLALFGGTRTFERVRGTPNLVRPDPERFLAYSREFFNARHYTNAGPVVRRLEARLAMMHQVRHCVAFSNAFWCLVMAMRSLALPGCSEVVMPSLTYRRLADIVSWAGLTPHFCEVDPQTLAMDAERAACAINEHTALLLAPHPIVNLCDIDGLERLSQSTGIPLLFDAVESANESHAGRRIGSFGNGECFSMHSSKLINGFEGGYLTTNDGTFATRMAHMRGFGFVDQDRVVELGHNAKLNEIHAAMALASLDDLPDQLVRNRARYDAYETHLAAIPEVRLLKFDEHDERCFKSIVIEFLDTWPLSREATIDLLHAEGALVRPYYSPPQHKKKMAYATVAENLHVTESLATRFLLLPCGHRVDEADIRAVVALLCFFRDHAAEINSILAGGN
ncbi:MAG: DegT/DnrJ/EryC1/StrS family aminotransferase [Vulcanimicrobiaceae bacterium]